MRGKKRKKRGGEGSRERKRGGESAGRERKTWKGCEGLKGVTNECCPRTGVCEAIPLHSTYCSWCKCSGSI